MVTKLTTVITITIVRSGAHYHCTPEANVMLHIMYTSIKQIAKQNKTKTRNQKTKTKKANDIKSQYSKFSIILQTHDTIHLL